jgi:MFS family permease
MGSSSRRCAGLIPALPRPFWYLFAGTLVNSFGFFVVPFLVPYAVHRGVPVALSGLTLGAYGIGAIAASIAGGVLTDAIGERWVVVVSMAGSAASMLVLGLVSGLVLLIPACLVAGLFANLFRPASGALVARLTTPEDRPQAYAAYRLAVNIGTSAGPAVAGVLADRSFLLVFLGDGLTSLVFFVIALAALPAGREGPASESKVAGPGGVLRDGPFLLFMTASAVWAIVYYQGIVGLPLQIRVEHIPNAVYGALISLNGLLVVLLELVATRFTRSLPRAGAIATGIAIIGLGYGLTAFATTVPTLVVTVLIWTLGEILASPLAIAYVMDFAPAEARGRYQGTWNLTRSAGLVGAPLIGGGLFGLSPGLLWSSCAAGGVVGAACTIAADRLRRRRAHGVHVLGSLSAGDDQSTAPQSRVDG